VDDYRRFTNINSSKSPRLIDEDWDNWNSDDLDNLQGKRRQLPPNRTSYRDKLPSPVWTEATSTLSGNSTPTRTGILPLSGTSLPASMLYLFSKES